MKRSIRITIFLFVFCSTFICCKHKDKSNESITTIKFDFKKNNVSFEDVFEKKTASFIQLETNENCLISEITQMEVWDDKIFILDWKLNSLLVFNTNGKFLNRIGKLGRGPGEYIRPRYFFVSKKEASVKVFDAPMRKLICYDFNGKLINEVNIKHYLRAIGETSFGYWGFCPNKSNEKVDDQQKKVVKFITFDRNGEVHKYIKGEKSIDNCNISPAYIIDEFEKSVSYVEPYLTNIYTLKDDKVGIKYRIDFLEKSLPYKLLKEAEKISHPLNKAEEKLLSTLLNSYPSLFTHFFETEEFLLLRTSFKSRTLIYYKKRKSSVEFSGKIFSLDSWKTFFSPCCMVGNTVYCQANYSDIKNELGNIKDNTDKRTESLSELFGKIKYNDNPLILKYVIKQ